MSTRHFNLSSLPLCGAQTRQGQPCRRFGTKKNGRCKLHGGRSTGARTEEGKLASSLNATESIPNALITGQIPLRYREQAIEGLRLLDGLMGVKPIKWDDICQVMVNYRMSLEMLKYYILENEGIEAFVLIQSALDGYYQHINASHLGFHIHSPMIMPIEYPVGITRAQVDALLVRTHKQKIAITD